MSTRVTFIVSDHVAEEMTHRSVYIDVFDNVRWTDNTDWTGATVTKEHIR